VRTYCRRQKPYINKNVDKLLYIQNTTYDSLSRFTLKSIVIMISAENVFAVVFYFRPLYYQLGNINDVPTRSV